MHTIKRIFIYLLVLDGALVLFGQTNLDRVTSRGEVFFAFATNNSVSYTPPQKNETHWFVLSGFSIQKRDADSPRKFTFSGVIKDKNAWAFAQQIPIFFGSDLHSPRLAAVTDSRGSFSFNVLIKEDSRSGELQCSAITNGAIFIASANIFMVDAFDRKRFLTADLVRKYSLVELISPSKPTNSVAANQNQSTGR